MQALWSRAARNPGTCKFIPCISNTTSITRPAGAFVIKRPWVFGTPTSTFVYTAIFAVGLTIDAKAKQRRNEQWEAAFALLREELEKPSLRRNKTMGDKDNVAWQQKRTRREKFYDVFVDGKGISLHDDIPVEELFAEDLDWDNIYRVTGIELTDDHVFQVRQAESSIDMQHISKHMWKLLAFDTRFPGAEILEWPANTGQSLHRYYLPPQSLWSPDEMRRKSLRNRQTWKKLLIQELSIGSLIHDLLRPNLPYFGQLSGDVLHALSPAIYSISILSLTESKRRQREILNSIEAIKQQLVDTSFENIADAKRFKRYLEIPQYFQDEDGDYYTICQQMNMAIKQILFGEGDTPVDRNQVSLTLAKVCHNLLVSSSAPDVQTFNILISGLARWSLPDLVDRVISAFYHCKIRPNEITCVAILNHYLQCNRPEAFSKFVARMRGVHKGGLMLANPTITVNERGEKRLIRVSKNKVIQKVHPTPLVFNTLMLGALKFAGCTRAIDIYYEMKEDGWGLDITGLTHFLDDCIREANWSNGLYIWNEILSILSKSNSKQMETAYSRMLSLCSVTGNTAAFNQLLKEVVDQGLDRRFVVKSALAVAKKLHSQPGSAAPPMTADNVLFAISDYLVDRGNERVPEEGTSSTIEQDYNPQKESEENANAHTDNAFIGPEDTWSSWIQHELAESIDRNSTPQQDTEPEETWSFWVQKELVQKELEQKPKPGSVSKVVTANGSDAPK